MAVLAFGTTPLIFKYSHFVMLEIPMLALALGATYHFVVYLERETQRDLYLWGFLCAAAALTRFDVIYLLVLFPLLLTIQKKWGILLRREVLLTIVGALCLIAPVYAITASNVGWLHAKEVTQTMDPGEPPMLSLSRLLFYPAGLPYNLSWFFVGAAVVGIAVAVWRRDRSCLVFAAIIVVVYVTFTPIAEMRERHVIYWVPGLAFFAAEGVYHASRLWRQGITAGILGGAVFGAAFAQAVPHVRIFLTGYADVARYVKANTTSPPLCMYIGSLNGNFVYQMRRADPARRIWTLRGEKLADTLATAGNETTRPNADQMLAAIYRYSPTYILVEKVSDPARSADSEWLANLVQQHAERFRLAQRFPIVTNDSQYAGGVILVYRNLVPNPSAAHNVEVHIRILRQNVQGQVP
jgi:hypothetical protein